MKKDCFYSLFSNLIEFKNYTIDRQYGTHSLKKEIKFMLLIRRKFTIIL